ncbi:MAG: ribonuclease [Oscillospiraceae bacterium]|nr:ribonuclease [Oscillospiraceae bacterium]
MVPFTGCTVVVEEQGYVESKAEPTAPVTEAPAESESEAPADPTDAPTEAPTESESEAPATEAGTTPEPEAETEDDVVWGESYSTPEEVAEYIHLYGELPENFITKNEARDMGWESSEGNLWEVAPGMSIGGDYFGNYEGLLPDGRYRECDVNFDGGYRGAERIIYGEDGSVWYTDDHYESFTQLY